MYSLSELYIDDSVFDAGLVRCIVVNKHLSPKSKSKMCCVEHPYRAVNE